MGRERGFLSTVSLTSQTLHCKKEITEFEGQSLAVVDTPGLFDTEHTEDEVKTEIARCVSLASPGPHVFLLVLQLTRFTKEEQDSVKIIKTMFGERSGRYTMILFTHGDNMQGDVTIEHLIGQSQKHSDMLNECCGYHVFNNRDKDRSQVKQLVEKIKLMVERNGGGYYTSEMFEEAERAIQEEMKHEKTRRQAEEDNSFIRNAARNALIGGLALVVVTGATKALSKKLCTIQ